jgi:hypothetical protein
LIGLASTTSSSQSLLGLLPQLSGPPDHALDGAEPPLELVEKPDAMAGVKKMDAQEELVRLKVLELRRSAKTQAEMISELHRAGFGQTRIADLLGTSANTVNVALSKAKKRATKEPPGGDQS